MKNYTIILKQYFQGDNGNFQETIFNNFKAENPIQAINLMIEEYPHPLSTIIDIHITENKFS